MLDWLIGQTQWQKQDAFNRDQASRTAALTQLLLDKGIVTAEELERTRVRMVGLMDQLLAEKADAETKEQSQ